MKFLAKLFLSMAAIMASVQLSGAEEGALTVEDAWSRPTILLDRPGAAYFTIVNNAARDDRLVKASSPLADRVEIHVHKHENGVMKMVKVDHIPVAAHGETVVKPGGYHLMLFGLKQKLHLGDELPLILTFAQAGEIRVSAGISKKALALSGKKMDHKMDHKMNHDMKEHKH